MSEENSCKDLKCSQILFQDLVVSLLVQFCHYLWADSRENQTMSMSMSMFVCVCHACMCALLHLLICVAFPCHWALCCFNRTDPRTPQQSGQSTSLPEFEEDMDNAPRHTVWLLGVFWTLMILVSPIQLWIFYNLSSLCNDCFEMWDTRYLTMASM